MQFLRTLLVSTVLASATLAANASTIGLGSFTGSESIIDFNSATIGSATGAYTTQGVTFTTSSNSYMIQSCGGGCILGTTGAALNTSGAGNDLTVLFSTGISRFGMNFGTSSTGGPLSAIVTAYDSTGGIVESVSFPSFGNAFLGFDFASAVSRVVIDRTDSTGYFTFIDDVRFVEGGSVPEPGSLALLGAVALAGALTRRRKTQA